MGRGDPKSGTRWPGRKYGTSRPGRDVLVRNGGPGGGLAGHLLRPHEPTDLLNLLDLLFYNIKLYSAFWRENSWNHFNCSRVLAAPLQSVQNQRGRFDFYLRQPRLPLVTNGGLVAIGTDRYYIQLRAKFFIDSEFCHNYLHTPVW